MHKLTVTLKQHTPLIHFQHDQDGATLRASEVKPKLDRYLFDNAIGENFDESKCFFVGYSEKNELSIKKKHEGEGFKALDYKLSIKPLVNKRVNLNCRFDSDKNKWISDEFPLILSNMGGKDNLDELADFSMYETLELTFSAKNKDLLDIVESWIDLFFATNNFGQRQDKGFGSFSVIRINGKDCKFPSKEDLPENTRKLHFQVGPHNDERKKQEQLFGVIDFYWKCLKSGVNYTRNKQYPDRYIKSFLWIYLEAYDKTWEKRRVKQKFHLTTGEEKPENPNPASFARALLGCPDKFEYKNLHKTVSVRHNENDESSKIARIPSPICFKPIINGNKVDVYIFIDTKSIDKLRDYTNLEFVFECSGSSMCLNIDPNLIDFNELIAGFHLHLRTEIQKKSMEETDLERFIEENDLDEKKWFIPLDFNWRNILNGQWIELSKL